MNDQCSVGHIGITRDGFNGAGADAMPSISNKTATRRIAAAAMALDGLLCCRAYRCGQTALLKSLPSIRRCHLSIPTNTQHKEAIKTFGVMYIRCSLCWTTDTAAVQPKKQYIPLRKKDTTKLFDRPDQVHFIPISSVIRMPDS